MSIWLTSGIFLSGLILVSLASLVLVSGLERLATRLRLSGRLLGIFTALGGATPEIATALTALIAGHHDLSLGVVLGSSIFNLAALLGLSAIVTGRLYIRREALLVTGGVAVGTTVAASLVVWRQVSPTLGVWLIVLLLVPYLMVAGIDLRRIARLTLPAGVRKRLMAATVEINESAAVEKGRRSGVAALSMVAALGSLVLGSVAIVHSAVALGGWLGVSHPLIGTLILAVVMGIPDSVAALQLGVHGRGAAVASETLNSNTFNIVLGIALPALGGVPRSLSTQIAFAVWWLLGMSVITVVLGAVRGGLCRWAGSIIVGLYVVFAVVMLLQR